jgi:hypothetical protein
VNQIDAGVEFSYQGETYNPKATIDLDGLMQSHGRLPDLHRFLAQQYGIDTYSYLYEVMESHPIEYANASGLALQCLHDGLFDLAAFEQLWHENRDIEVLTQIAHQHLGLDDLQQEPKIKTALLAAYRLGQQGGK